MLTLYNTYNWRASLKNAFASSVVCLLLLTQTWKSQTTMFIGGGGGKASVFPFQEDNAITKRLGMSLRAVSQQILSSIVPWNRRSMGGKKLISSDFNDFLGERWILSIAINVYDCALENKQLDDHTSYLNIGVFKRFALQQFYNSTVYEKLNSLTVRLYKILSDSDVKLIQRRT